MTPQPFQPTVVDGLPSPYEALRGLIYFPRMIAKIRLHAAGRLPETYHANLGEGFDGRCVRFLGVEYETLKAETLKSEASDESLLEWCFRSGRRPNEEEIMIWSEFLMKRGWRDASRKVLRRRLRDAGLPEEGGSIETMFDFIDLDEGRPLRQPGADPL
ncbi:MAG TPA: DUF5069 domain-containing protein [Chthoniobacteraceae bacterium]|nr:DUF5069 domain-containing protein [Chthoniobacteraceae bacterium]